MSRSPPTSGQPIQRCLPHPPTSSSHRISGTPSTPRANDSVKCAHKQNPQMSPHKRAGDFTTSRSENPRCREWLFEPTFFVVDHAHQTGVILKNSGGRQPACPPAQQSGVQPPLTMQRPLPGSPPRELNSTSITRSANAKQV